MAKAPTNDIDVTFTMHYRNHALERQTGSYTASVKVRVDYPLGAFELILQVTDWPTEASGIGPMIGQEVARFADSLKESALSHVHIPKPPSPQIES
jgi:hypothetical protein